MFCLEGVAGLEPALTGLEAVSLPINQYAHVRSLGHDLIVRNRVVATIYLQ
jgi:hypothetical protein